MDELEGMAERLMELPRVLFERIKTNTEMIQQLNLQVERLVKLIAGLHDIDLEAIRKEFGVEDKQ